METSTTLSSSEQKPSVEVQAVVMQLWNVVRETTQMTSGVAAERTALAKKLATLENTLQQEQQKTAKMQHYIEHLEREAKTKEEEIAKVQSEYSTSNESNRRNEEALQELRRTHLEKEEHITQLYAQVQEQARIIAERVAEIVAQEDELERLRDELGGSNDRAMQVAERLTELEPLYIESQEDKARLTEETDRLRWQLTAVTEQTAQERSVLEAEQERKLTDVRAEQGRLLVELEEWKRLAGEAEQRIQALEETRREALANVQASTQNAEKAAQEAQTWQQIAEEQEQIFRTKEQELLINLSALEEKLAHANNDTERVRALQDDLQVAQNLLILEKAAHDQALQTLKATFAEEQEKARSAWQQELSEHVTEKLTAQEALLQATFQSTLQEQHNSLILKHSEEKAHLEDDLEAAQNLMDEEQKRFTKEREELQNAQIQALERVKELETETQTLRSELTVLQAQVANTPSAEEREEIFRTELQQKLAEQQQTFDAMLQETKREAQIRMETDLEATRQVLSMKDRELELLRTNVESLQASNTRAVQNADEREARITELEALLMELDAERNKLENAAHAASHLPSMSAEEREALAEKVRQMLTRVEAALEEEVR
jgi:chromosome segregation ATPase